jgi:hypothetical protein
MNPVFNKIKNWHLFTEKFGDDYLMHDASIKRFDLNGDELNIVLNTVFDTDDGKVYDVAFKFTNLVRLEANLEIGNDYAGGIVVEIDKIYKNLLRFTIESAYTFIECFNIELVSITEADPFQREMICLDDPDVTPDNSRHLGRN